MTGVDSTISRWRMPPGRLLFGHGDATGTRTTLSTASSVVPDQVNDERRVGTHTAANGSTGPRWFLADRRSTRRGSMVVHTAHRKLAWRLRAEDGQAIVEYSLIVALISVVAIAALGAIGVDITSLFTKVSTTLSGVES